MDKEKIKEMQTRMNGLISELRKNQEDNDRLNEVIYDITNWLSEHPELSADQFHKILGKKQVPL